jgi:hypothetical protein
VSLLAVGIVLASALLHATWNVLLSRVPRGHDTTAVGLAIGFVAWTPVALWRWQLDPGVWPYVLGSAALELTYFVLLVVAYARAPAHAVYPVARGLGPALLLPVVAITGSGIPALAGIGVLAISGGVLLTAWGAEKDRDPRNEDRERIGPRSSVADRKAVMAAVPVAVCIAAYTFLDGHGVRHADPATYLWLTMVPVVAALLITRLILGRLAPPRIRPPGRWTALRIESMAPLREQLRPSTVVFGLGTYAAYGLTLLALSLVPPVQIPAVAALRETSILFVLALSWLTARRAATKAPGVVTAAGAVLVFGGVAVLALS